MAKDEQALKPTRTIGGSAFLVCLSFIPLLIDLVIAHIKFLRRFLAFPLLGLMLAAGFWAGNRWYKVFSVDKGEFKDKETGELEKRPDWFVFATAIVVGIGVVMFLRELLTHEMARAFTDMLASPSDDD
jgi:hypothetical protein